MYDKLLKMYDKLLKMYDKLLKMYDKLLKMIIAKCYCEKLLGVPYSY